MQFKNSATTDYYIPTEKDKNDFYKSFSEEKYVYKIFKNNILHKVSELTFRAYTQYELISQNLAYASVDEKINALLMSGHTLIDIMELTGLNELQLDTIKDGTACCYIQHLWDRCYSTLILRTIEDDMKDSKLIQNYVINFPLFTILNRDAIINNHLAKHPTLPLLEVLQLVDDRPMLPFFNKLSDKEKSTLKSMLIGLIKRGIPIEGISQQFYYSRACDANVLFAPAYKEILSTIHLVNSYFGTNYSPIPRCVIKIENEQKRNNASLKKQAEIATSEFLEDLKYSNKDGITLTQLFLELHNRPDGVTISRFSKIIDMPKLAIYNAICYKNIIHHKFKPSPTLANELTEKIGIPVFAK